MSEEDPKQDLRKSHKKAVLSIVAFGMVSYIICNSISDYTGVDSVWFIGNSFAFFMYAIALRITYNHFITNILTVVTLAALLDELTGYAEIVSITEYLILTLYILTNGISILINRKS